MANQSKNKRELLMVEIIKTSGYIERKITEVLKEFEITPIHYNILRILKGAHPTPLSAGEIKERMLFPNPDVTRLIDRMIKRNIVERNICEKNRRKMDILITKDGIELLKRIYPKLEKATNHFFSNEINETSAKTISNQLEKIRNSLKS